MLPNERIAASTVLTQLSQGLQRVTVVCLLQQAAILCIRPLSHLFVSPDGEGLTFETEAEGVTEPEFMTDDFAEAGWREDLPVSRIPVAAEPSGLSQCHSWRLLPSSNWAKWLPLRMATRRRPRLNPRARPQTARGSIQKRTSGKLWRSGLQDHREPTRQDRKHP